MNCGSGENENEGDNYDNNDDIITEPEHMRKLFIGGLDYRTTDDALKAYFEQWGNIVDVVVMKDPKTKRSRGFGFVTFSQSYMVDSAQCARPHQIDGRVVEPKRAVPRQEIGQPNAGASIKKLFVGGLREDHDEDCLREYFKAFGDIMAIQMVIDKATGKKRGFAFLEFDDYDVVDKIILQRPHTINNKRVDVNKAAPKQNVDHQVRSISGGSGGGRGGRRGGQAGGWGGNRGNGGGSNWGGNNYGTDVDFGGGNQGGGGGAWGNQPAQWGCQPTIDNDAGYNNKAGYGGAPGNSGWNNTGNFGNDYQQSYGGGPQKNLNFTGNNRVAPYNPGFKGGANQGTSYNVNNAPGAPGGGNVGGGQKRC